MEQNLQIIAKKFWHMVRVAMFMLRKGISKSKLLADLHMHMMMKRGKIAGKAIHNLMFHHTHHWAASSSTSRRSSYNSPFPPPPGGHEYEFSCSSSPAYPSLFNLPSKMNHKRKNHPHYQYYSQSLPSFSFGEEDQFMTAGAVMKALEMLHSETASPALPGFGRSPMVRQLRITDSPFPLKDGEEAEDGQVNEAAEKFIKKFYKDLRKQSAITAF